MEKNGYLFASSLLNHSKRNQVCVTILSFQRKLYFIFTVKYIGIERSWKRFLTWRNQNMNQKVIWSCNWLAMVSRSTKRSVESTQTLECRFRQSNGIHPYVLRIMVCGRVVGNNEGRYTKLIKWKVQVLSTELKDHARDFRSIFAVPGHLVEQIFDGMDFG